MDSVGNNNQKNGGNFLKHGNFLGNLFDLFIFFFTSFVFLIYVLNNVSSLFIYLGSTLDQSINDLSLDPFESKSRKSSGFSSNAGDSVITANGKSRQYSGYDMDNKSRNCSGNSIPTGLGSSGIFNSAAASQNNGGSTAPVMIPGSSNISPKGGSPLMQSTLTNGIINEQSNNTGDNVSYFLYHGSYKRAKDFLPEL